jgi:23S rRNA pseudouridine1911/1915/1917 synthase
MRPLAPGETPPPRDCFPAETAWHPVEKRPDLDATLLEVVIRSGVTHQIRCHLAAAGHPILGDRLYGSARPLPRHLLHASSATFRHPATAARTTLSAPLPPDFSL